MLTHSYNIKIDRGVGAPGHVREIVGGLDTNEMFSFNVNDNCETDWCSRL